VPQQRGDGAGAPEARREEEGLEAVAVARRHGRAVLREAVDRRRPVRHRREVHGPAAAAPLAHGRAVVAVEVRRVRRRVAVAQHELQ
jgi:hypothetical protein